MFFVDTGSRLEEIDVDIEYPFDIFICVAMLMECRTSIMQTFDIGAMYQLLAK